MRENNLKMSPGKVKGEIYESWGKKYYEAYITNEGKIFCKAMGQHVSDVGIGRSDTDQETIIGPKCTFKKESGLFKKDQLAFTADELFFTFYADLGDGKALEKLSNNMA